MTITKKVPQDMSSMRLDKVSSEIFTDYSRTQIKKWINDGRILLNDEFAAPKEKVFENDEIQKANNLNSFLSQKVFRFGSNTVVPNR